MPIDVQTVRSPGWWLKRLWTMLADPDRRQRLQMLFDYHRGHAPLPEGAENAREAFEAFQRKARSNFAELIVSAMSERMTPVGFRTAIDADVTGDAEVAAMWVRAGLNVTSADVHDFMLAMGESFVVVGGLDEETGAPQITCEDPRYMVGEEDPANPRRLLASLKVVYDDQLKEDRAYLYLPGNAQSNSTVWVAVRKSNFPQLNQGLVNKHTRNRQDRLTPLPSFDEKSWEWDENRSGTLPHKRMPVVKFTNKYGMGEYEQHLDLLDRINHQILQRMIIAVMQAFRQRAIKGLPMFYPEGHAQAGQQIDYNNIFTADPAALWQLPIGAEMWESAINDLRPILEAVKADLEHLGSVTRTPLHMLTAGGDNQSAEGASLAREGLVFKVEDRIGRTSYAWALVVSLALLHMGQPERADMSKLETIWAPAQRLSLSERADAASKVKDLLPRRTLLINVMGMSPAAADRAMSELADEQVLAAQLTGLLAASSPLPGAPASVLPAAVPAGPTPIPEPAIPQPAPVI